MAIASDVAKLTDWFVEAGADSVTMKLADEVVLPSLTVTSPMLTLGRDRVVHNGRLVVGGRIVADEPHAAVRAEAEQQIVARRGRKHFARRVPGQINGVGRRRAVDDVGTGDPVDRVAGEHVRSSRSQRSCRCCPS